MTINPHCPTKGAPIHTCNCPVERPGEPHGSYYSAPRCILDEWHRGPHIAADGSTCLAYIGGALCWWADWIELWGKIGETMNPTVGYRTYRAPHRHQLR